MGVGAQSTMAGKTFFPENYVQKINKMPEFYVIIARKYFSRFWGEGWGAYAPVSYA